jgi:hypothetical protein
LQYYIDSVKTYVDTYLYVSDHMEIYLFEICKTSWRNWRYYQEQMLFFLGVVDYVVFEHCCMLLIKTCCVVLICTYILEERIGRQ